MTALRYIGPARERGMVLPLPEGWPAADHEDSNEDRATEKLLSGKYALVVDPDAAPADEVVGGRRRPVRTAQAPDIPAAGEL